MLKICQEDVGGAEVILREEDMSTQLDTDHRVLEVIMQLPGTVLDEIVVECPDLTRSQVFLAIDRLSRTGVLKLTPQAHGCYTIRLSNHALEEMRGQSYAGIFLP
jgi:hypothetical protein